MNCEQGGMVFDIQRWSLHDGPGIRTNVFLKGCPLACIWCSNPESQSGRQELAFFRDKCIGCGSCIGSCHSQSITKGADGMIIDFERCRTFCSAGQLNESCFQCTKTCYARALDIMGEILTAEAVIAAVLRDQPIYDSSGGGMTVTGGEPFAQPEFLLALVTLAKAAGLHTVIESCLYAPWEIIEEILPFVDYMFMDLKVIDEEKHKAVTRRDNRLILENMKKIHDQYGKKGLEMTVRTPVVPGINDKPADIGAIADWIAGELPAVTRYELLPYHRLGRGKYAGIGKVYQLADLSAPSETTMEQLKGEIRKRGLQTK